MKFKKEKLFRDYYESILSEQDFEILKKPLPTTFRFAPNSVIPDAVKKLCQAIPFVNRAFMLDIEKTVLRRNPEYKDLHKYLVAETEAGNISRQEAVSMIPPLFLNVESDHVVLDMCASPGSKTAQLLEGLHGKNEAIPKGYVIANDADYKRCYMLVRQAKRLDSPCLIVTNHEAQFFPNIYLSPKGAPKKEILMFDRILCDVPCSGDGTLRKNVTIWDKWTPKDAFALHRTQVSILSRGIDLLKVGGYIVYSTCSLNPIENEAVVAEALSKHPHMTLVDTSDTLPGLKHVAGFTSWKVMTADGKFHDNYEDMGEHLKKSIASSCFSREDFGQFNLERCLRIHPGLQNTGGFFVALFKKNYEPEKTEIKVNNEVKETKELIETPANQEVENEESPPKKVKLEETVAGTKKAWAGKESPFVFLNAENPDVQSIMKGYGFSDSFPIHQLTVRSESGPHRTIYFVSEGIYKLFQSPSVHRLKIINSGVKLFTRNEGDGTLECPYRINNEGVPIIKPFISEKRILNVAMDDLLKMLDALTVPYTLLQSELQQVLTESPIGCYLIHTQTREHVFFLPVWKGRGTLNLLVNKQEKFSCLTMLTGKFHNPIVDR